MEHNRFEIDEETGSLETLIKKEILNLSRTYIKINQAKICSSDSVLLVDLGSCVSVVLCGITEEGELHFGANHLFKSRDENSDMALEQISELFKQLQEVGAVQIQCVGVFGAGYREKSLAQHVAKKNIMTVLETLSLFNLDIEIFQTGYSQGLMMYHSQTQNALIVRLKNLGEKTYIFYRLPIKELFPSGAFSPFFTGSNL
ncbi:MAG: hypothetical protein PF637_08225 [Spirochaetes bacterium]|jgi:chemotaxis receptor (MCP) glutamine deamidase CheD|nr:hypothetical protein [Spirochaetota bacterium]